MYNRKIIDDLFRLGFKIMFLPEMETYIIPISHTLYNPSNHIHQTTIFGRDITEMIMNFGSNFSSKETLLTNIEKLPEKNWTLHKDIKFIYIS